MKSTIHKYKFLQIQYLALVILSLCFIQTKSKAQAHDPGRGMYVDAFALALDTHSLIPAYSILGNQAKEDSLFLFAKENHITYLALYNLFEIFQGDTIKTQLDNLLYNFILRARQEGVKKVGAVVSSVERLGPIANFPDALPNPSKAWTFTNEEKLTPAYPNLQFVENSYNNTNSLFEVANLTRLMLEVTRYNKIVAQIDSTAKFDVLSFEDEFWNPGNLSSNYPTYTDLFNKSKILMDAMANVRAMNNSTSNLKISTEIYLGIVDSLPGLPQDTIVKYLDRSRLTNGLWTHDSLPLFNRVLATYYHVNPDGSYNRSEYRSRFLAFQNATTNDSTRIFPLFSSGSKALGYSENLFGYWFARSPRYNHFAAEKIWYDSALTDSSRDTTIQGNYIERGAAMWYTYSSLSQNPMNASLLNHPHTFYSNTPLYLNGNQKSTAKFTYNGPLEAGIICDLKIDSAGTIIYSKSDTTKNSNKNFNLPNIGNRDLSAGEYWVSLKLDYGNNTSYTYKEKFTVNNQLTLEAVGDTPMCDNGSIVLRASRIDTSATVRYAWYYNDSTTAILFTYNDTNYIEAKNPGKYFCKIKIGAQNSVFTNSIVIRTTPNTIPTFTFGKPSGPSSVFIIANGTEQTGTSYKWSNGDTSKVAEVHYSDTYKVTVTQPNGCYRSAKVKVNVNNFSCSNKGDSLMVITSSQIPNRKITGNAVIRDTFVVDSSLILNAANLTCRPGAKILVKNGATLTIENSSILQSCGDTLWAGIEVEKGGEVISLSSNTISEARHGIQLNDSSNYKIENTIFDNNYIGIYLTGMYHKIGNTIYNSGSTYHCSFKNTSDLLQPYTTMLESIGTNGLAGIQVRRGKMFINLNNSTNPTTFDNLSNGIIADSNSYMVTHHTKFNHIHADTTYNAILPFGNGSGVLVQDNAPTYAQRVASNRTNTNFLDCDYGVYALNSSIDVKQVTMDSVMRGVYIHAINPMQTHRALITLNNITAINKGVSIFNADFSHATVVLGNKISIGTINGPSNKVAIDIKLTTNVPDTSLKIINNEIYCSNADGIVGQNATYSTIKGNFIKFDTNTNNKRMGILLNGCKGSLIENNVIKGDYDTTRTDELLTGIRTSMSDSITITCNQVDSTAIGFKFASASNYSEFRANGMHSNKFGLYLDTSGSIGIQNHQGNLFNGKYKALAAVNYNLAQIANSEFDVYGDSIKIYYPAGKISPATGWFVSDTISNEYQCQLTSTYIPYNLGGTIWIGGTAIPIEDYQYMRMVASDSLQPAEFPTETQEIAEDELYQLLLQHPEFLSDPELNSFYLIESQTALGELNKLRQMQEEFPSEVVQARNNLSSAEYYLSETDREIEILLAIIEAEQETEQTYVLLEQLYHARDIQTEDYNNKYNLYHDAFTEYFDQLNDLNLSISVNTLIQENEQIVNTISFETIGAGIYTFNSAQKSLLASVATQCPKAGGKAVYRARALYALICDTILYHDDSNCAQQGFYRKKKDEIKKMSIENFNYSVRPNPAKDFISVTEIPENSNIRISNSQGLNVYQANLNESTSTIISSASFANGVYFITIQNSNGIKTKKISILH